MAQAGTEAPSPSVERSGDPRLHLLGSEKDECRALHCVCFKIALCHRDQQIASPGNGDADCGVAGAIGHVEIIAPGTAAQISDVHFLAGRNRGQINRVPSRLFRLGSPRLCFAQPIA